MKQSLRSLFVFSMLMLLSACGFFDKDNVAPPHPLVAFKPQLAVQRSWSAAIGNGTGGQYLKLSPAHVGNIVYANSQNGELRAIEAGSGKTLWQRSFVIGYTSGIAATPEIVVMGVTNGQVIGVSARNGAPLWHTDVASQVLAKPVIANNTVIVKTVASKVIALDLKTGQIRWNYQEQQAPVQLRVGSAPQVQGNLVIVGFANGMLDALRLSDGSLVWQHLLAEPVNSGSFVQQMTDIDANPVIAGNTVYVAGYHSILVALDLATGQEHWKQTVSSYSGLVLTNNAIYVVSSDGDVIAVNRHSGKIIWTQDELARRGLSSPVFTGNALVVGDSEGYVHWLSPLNGHMLAREKVGKGAIIATPVVNAHHVLVMDNRGNLVAFRDAR